MTARVNLFVGKHGSGKTHTITKLVQSRVKSVLPNVIDLRKSDNIEHTKALIFLGIAANKDDCIVIDPIDIGIHHMLFGDIWESIFKLAIKHNTEVYATAYSIDALRGFYTAWKKYPDNGSLTRIERKDIGNKLVTIDLEILGDAIETNVSIM